MARTWFLLLLVLPFCRPQTAQGVLAYTTGFRVTLRSGEPVDAYVIKPSALLAPTGDTMWQQLGFHWRSRANADLADRLLGYAADFIDFHERNLGHVTPQTRVNHQREIRRLRAGRWPTVVITEPGAPEKVLLTVAIAIPWRNETLPFQNRFYRRHIPGLPDRYPGIVVEMQNFFDEERGYLQPAILFNKELGSFSMEPDLSVVLSQLPWAVGQAGELKFLRHREGVSLELSAVAHALICAHGMHRFAADPLPPFMRAQQVDFMSEPTIKAHFQQALAAVENTRLEKYISDSAGEDRSRRLIRSFFAGLREVLWQPSGFQRHAAISTLYAQVSEKESTGRGRLNKLFLSRFRFPSQPLHDFMETADFGTPGVRTRIYALKMENFDLDMLDGLNTGTEVLAGGIHFNRLPWTKGSCPDLVVDHMSEAQARARRIFFEPSQP